MDYTTTTLEHSQANSGPMNSLASVLCGGLLAFGAPGAAIAAQQGPIRPKANPVTIDSAVEPEETAAVQQDPINASAGLKLTREAFGLNVTELAEIFDVSRPTIYKWLKGGEVKREVGEKIQVLAAFATHWNEQKGGKAMSFLLDYQGPHANQPSIRKELKKAKLDVNTLTQLNDLRLTEYHEAAEKSRQLIGEARPAKGGPISKGTRKLNQRWTENTTHLKGSGK